MPSADCLPVKILRAVVDRIESDTEDLSIGSLTVSGLSEYFTEIVPMENDQLYLSFFADRLPALAVIIETTRRYYENGMELHDTGLMLLLAKEAADRSVGSVHDKTNVIYRLFDVIFGDSGQGVFEDLDIPGRCLTVGFPDFSVDGMGRLEGSGKLVTIIRVTLTSDWRDVKATEAI